MVERRSAVACIILALAACAAATRTQGILQGRGLLGSSASASASARSYSFKEDAIVTAFAEAIAEAHGPYNQADVHSAAQATGEAYAEAYASVSGRVEVTGNGQATSKAQAHAEATATLVAKAVAKGVARGSTKNRKVNVNIDATSLAKRIVDASASAVIELSSTRGVASGSQESLAFSVATVVVDAIADAWVVNSADESHASTSGETNIKFTEDTFVDSVADVKVKGDSDADAHGVANAEVTKAKFGRCRGFVGRCCRENWGICKTHSGTIHWEVVGHAGTAIYENKSGFGRETHCSC